MFNRSAIFRTAWRNARLEAGTRYGITLTLKKAFRIELRKAWAAAKEAVARSARLAAGIAAAGAELRRIATTGGILPATWSPRQSWRYVNANPCGGGL